MVNLIMIIFFGIYAWNNPDHAECFSWHESNAAIENPIGIPNAKDVTSQFHHWFIFGFVIALISLMYSVFACLFIITKKKILLGVGNSFFILALLGNAGWTIVGTVFRHKHPGKVCSGDYFNVELYKKVPPFQWKSGRFIYVFLVILWIFWSVLIVIGATCFIYRRIRAKDNYW